MRNWKPLSLLGVVGLTVLLLPLTADAAHRFGGGWGHRGGGRGGFAGGYRGGSYRGYYGHSISRPSYYRSYPYRSYPYWSYPSIGFYGSTGFGYSYWPS